MYLIHFNFLTACECFIAYAAFCIINVSVLPVIVAFLIFLYSTPHHKVGIPNFLRQTSTKECKGANYASQKSALKLALYADSPVLWNHTGRHTGRLTWRGVLVCLAAYPLDGSFWLVAVAAVIVVIKRAVKPSYSRWNHEQCTQQPCHCR